MVNEIIREDARWVVDRMGAALDPLRGTTFLVTGACGFLCSFVLDVCAELNSRGGKPVRVLAVDNFASGLPERVAHLADRPEFKLITHDVSQPFDPGEPVHWIWHGASVASPTFYRRFPLETIDVNVNGTRQFLELARKQPGVRGMVFMSTSEIYGDPTPDSIPTPETYRGFVSCTGPRACYDESKRLGETLCSNYHRLYGTPIKVIRPFNVYGPGQRLDDKRILPDLMSAALKREPIVLHSDGRATRAFCYLRDGVWGMLHVLIGGEPGEAYNVGNDHEEIGMLDLAKRLVEVAGPPTIPIEHKLSDDPHYLSDNPQRRCPDLAKMKRSFPWSPQVDLREGLSRCLRSYEGGAR